MHVKRSLMLSHESTGSSKNHIARQEIYFARPSSRTKSTSCQRPVSEETFFS